MRIFALLGERRKAHINDKQNGSKRKILRIKRLQRRDSENLNLPFHPQIHLVFLCVKKSITSNRGLPTYKPLKLGKE